MYVTQESPACYHVNRPLVCKPPVDKGAAETRGFIIFSGEIYETNCNIG